jgi:hypothetical protein
LGYVIIIYVFRILGIFSLCLSIIMGTALLIWLIFVGYSLVKYFGKKQELLKEKKRLRILGTLIIDEQIVKLE